MGLVDDLSRALREARRAAKLLLELSELKQQLQALKQELARERQRREALERAISRHRKAMEDCPRSWESDQALWRALEPR